MTLTLELSPELERLLVAGANAQEKSPAQFVEAALQEPLNRRNIDDAIAAIRLGGGSLGRNGRPWRELTHEAHKY